MQPKNLTDLELMEGIEDEGSGWSVAFGTEKTVGFMDLPLMIITIEQDSSALNSRPAQVRAVVQQKSKVWAPETVEDIGLRSSMKARSKGNSVLLVVNLDTLTCREYSSIMFIPAKKRIKNIPHWCLCQALLADSENDLLNIPL